MTNSILENETEHDVDQIVSEFVEKGGNVFDGDEYPIKVVHQIVTHPDFPQHVRVSYPE